jgi:phospholipid/cholesterol/gamma-HCH transport system substrate-binding protein
MLKAHTPILVGLLVLIGAAAFLFTFGSLDKGVDLDESYRVEAIFDDATGLVLHSRVMLSGIPVGAITEIGLDDVDTSRAKVSMAISRHVMLYEGIWEPVLKSWRNGATASRLQASLLGDYYVAITPGIAGPVITEGGQIKNTVAESGLGAVINQLDESTREIFPKLDKIVEDISAITGSLRTNFAGEEGTAALAEIRDNVRHTTKEVAALSTEVRTFVNDRVISQGEDVQRIISNIEELTARLRDATGRASDRMDAILGNVDHMTSDLRHYVGDQITGDAGTEEGTVAHAVKGLDRSVSHLEGTLENTKDITGRISAGEGTIGRLVTDSELIDNVEKVVEDISEFTQGLSRLQVKVEFRSEYLLGQASLKNYVNISLFPKPDKFYFFQVIADPQGAISRKRKVTTSNDPSKPPVLVEESVILEDDLKFTAQFGKRWHFFTFRYGIMESTGGIGLDVELLEDALRFKLDAFDFGRDDWPRLRLLAAWEFFRHLYVAAGVDNMLNNASRDYFFGLGANFTDDDLKSILPFAPSL